MSPSKPYVLIAEDDEFLAKMMRLAVTDHGAAATVVSDGKQAISAIKKRVPDVLLLDLLMPEIDGYGVLQSIADGGTDLPVIVVSNVDSAEDRAKCKKLGVKEFLVKSDMDTDALWPAIQKALR